MKAARAMPRPRLTVILIVYREQAYVRECVTSVIEQSFRDVELLAVDNASPDHAPEILDELARADPRIVVRHLDAPVTLGEARNVALDSATGDYVWFVEATDRLPAGAAADVAARLDEMRPDVLVVEHTRAGPLTRPRSGGSQHVIRAAPREAFTVEEYPRATQLALDVRDKIFRRAFLRERALRFRPGGYGHLSVTYPALLVAERISVLPRICYARYEPPNAANEPSVHGTPFEVFEQYDAVLEFVASQGPRLASSRGSVVRQMLSHYAAIASELPAPARKDFLAAASGNARRHAGGNRPIATSLRLRLATSAALHRARRSRLVLASPARKRTARLRRLRGARRLTRRLARLLGGKGLDPYYRLQLRAPVEPDLAVFASYWYRGYSCNPRAVYEKLREMAPWIRAVWVVDKEHAAEMPAGVEYVVAGTRDYYRLIARAKYFVNNVNFPNDFVKRPGTIHVQTHHGTPLKKMGLDLRGAFVAGSRMNFERLLQRVARWDYSVSSNAFSTLVWERVYPMPYETLEVGYPRNDALVNASDTDVARIRNELGIDADDIAVLYAPTHREYLSGYNPTIAVDRFAEALGPAYVVMERRHYFYARDGHRRSGGGTGRVLDVTSHPVEEVCLAADVLVTDYSALMFDYAVLDRPIVIHAPDWDEYRSLRGTYFDLLAEPPGVVARTEAELLAAFRSNAVWGEEAARLRAAFRARFARLDDGRAAERVVRRVWLSGREPVRPSLDSSGHRRRTVEP